VGLNPPFKVADEVQIRMRAAGMCHSDYHLTTGAAPIGLPALGGHKASVRPPTSPTCNLARPS
jgi:Zn-dependent alcohol dehydrogenase